MALFGIKKVNEEVKPTNNFINTDVINANDYDNMPNNIIVGYNQPTTEQSYNNGMVNNSETFVYSQVNINDYNNQMSNNNMIQQNNQQSYYNNQLDNSTTHQQPNQQYYYNQYQNNNISSNQYNTYDSYNNQNATINTEVNNSDGSVVYENVAVNQTYPVEQQIPFDNSALFQLPAGAVIETQQIEEEQPSTNTNIVETSTFTEEQPIALDPLNNGNNPIPVNPVATVEKKVEEIIEDDEEEILFFEEEEIKNNLFTIINMMIGIITKPSTTISLNALKYKKVLDSLIVTLWVTIISFIMTLICRILCGCFSKSYGAVSGITNINFDISGLFDVNNYVPYLLLSFLVSAVFIAVVVLVYYGASFIYNKGIHMGTYIIISSLSSIPVIIGFTVIQPILSIISSSLGIISLVVCFIYTLLILFTGINRVLKFKDADLKIRYNAINIAIIFIIMISIINLLNRLNIINYSIFL